MTLQEAIQRVETDRPGESTREEMRKWLSQLDGKWLTEVVSTHEDGEELTGRGLPSYGAESGSEALMIAPPYDEVYIHFLYSKIDYRLGEIDRYNNAAALFNQEWREAVKAYNRAHMPKRGMLRHIAQGMSLSEARADGAIGDDPLNQRRE